MRDDKCQISKTRLKMTQSKLEKIVVVFAALNVKIGSIKLQ